MVQSHLIQLVWEHKIVAVRLCPLATLVLHPVVLLDQILYSILYLTRIIFNATAGRLSAKVREFDT